jgi:predicted lipoprotein with Yx(FWY)xxD motif
MKLLAVLAQFSVLALIAAGCGGGEETKGTDSRSSVAVTVGAPRDPQPAAAPGIARPAAAPGARLGVVDSQFGRVVADRHGEALYLFDRERNGKSECYGACAKAWPPLLTEGRPVAAGAKRGLLGTTRREDGRLQVTYAGHPLYYYVSDSPGTILCHDVEEFGGTWLVVKPTGEPAA